MTAFLFRAQSEFSDVRAAMAAATQPSNRRQPLN